MPPYQQILNGRFGLSMLSTYMQCRCNAVSSDNIGKVKFQSPATVVMYLISTPLDYTTAK